jgi:putative transposase
MSFAELEKLRTEVGLGVNAFLRCSGVSKSTYYRRKRRGRGKRNPPPELEAAIKRLCDEHPRLGYRPIHAKLRKTQAASASTVYRVMKRLGLCQKQKRHASTVISAPAPLQLEQLGLTVGLDFTHWDRKPICNVLEYESRYCLATVVSERETSEAATAALDLALQEAKRLGLPYQGIEVKSDRGSTFTAAPFRAFLNEQTCQQTLSAVGRPQGMGRVERFNRSLKEQGLQPEELDPGESLQPLLDTYRSYYNHHRPHQALDYLTPLEFLRSQGYNSVPLN